MFKTLLPPLSINLFYCSLYNTIFKRFFFKKKRNNVRTYTQSLIITYLEKWILLMEFFLLWVSKEMLKADFKVLWKSIWRPLLYSSVNTEKTSFTGLYWPSGYFSAWWSYDFIFILSFSWFSFMRIFYCHSGQRRDKQSGTWTSMWMPSPHRNPVNASLKLMHSSVVVVI